MNIRTFKTPKEVLAYEDGLNDAWGCAKRILDLDCSEVATIFKELVESDMDLIMPKSKIFEHYTPSDAIYKIATYEKERVTREKIIDAKLNELINMFTTEEVLKGLHRLSKGE